MELNLNKQEVIVSYERIKAILDSEQEDDRGIIIKGGIKENSISTSCIWI